MIQLTSPDQNTQATINPIGAALAELWIGDVQIAGNPDPFSGVTMFPWPNRIYGGQWLHHGELQSLPINDQRQNSALHGLVFSREFSVTELSESSCTLLLELDPQVGYPFSTAIEVTFTVAHSTLYVKQLIRNLGSTETPFAIGWHPYFLADETSQFQFGNDQHLLAGWETDTTFGPGREDAVLQTKNYKLSISATDTDYFHVYTNRYDTPGSVWFAIEPQSSPVDSLNTGIGVTRLQPGETRDFSYRLTWQS